MGTDIRVLTEFKRNGKWVNCDNWGVNPYFEEDEREPKYELKPVYWKRDYDLFTTLAGVGYVETHLPRICEPRGLPDDISNETKDCLDCLDSFGYDLYYHSFFTLKELWDYWNDKGAITIQETFLLTPDEAKQFDRTGVFREKYFLDQVRRKHDFSCCYETRTIQKLVRPLDCFLATLTKHFADVFGIDLYVGDGEISGAGYEETLKESSVVDAVQKYGDSFRVIFCFDD